MGPQVPPRGATCASWLVARRARPTTAARGHFRKPRRELSRSRVTRVFWIDEARWCDITSIGLSQPADLVPIGGRSVSTFM